MKTNNYILNKIKSAKNILVKFWRLGSKNIFTLNPRLGWFLAQKGEKKWWHQWSKSHVNDDQWLNSVMEYFGINEGQDFGSSTLVDVGSGPIGILTKINATQKIAVDPLDMKTQDSQIKRIMAPGEKIPLLDGSSDAVFIYNVLQHVMSPIKVLDEGKRILKRGGKFYILEQLNLPTNLLHPHSLKIELFNNWLDKNDFIIEKKMVQKDSCFEFNAKNSTGFSILCLILIKK